MVEQYTPFRAMLDLDRFLLCSDSSGQCGLICHGVQLHNFAHRFLSRLFRIHLSTNNQSLECNGLLKRDDNIFLANSLFLRCTFFC
jgi:hypothetical protein